ncbi:hypothetical protein AB0451_19670 [Streptomyces sp. NPDC052000]|uniref:hypothetical protein n=1 Tax=Streptomyces sp. NPDC052000 TaxID=3155676 RepID=UPI003450B663
MSSLIHRVNEPQLFIDANTLDLLDPETMETGVLDHTGNGLVAVTDQGAAAIVTATESGHIHVTVELWDGAPPLHLDGWQDAAEISIGWTGQRIELGCDPDDAPHLDLPPGSYRLLAHGRGRDSGDVEGGDPPETYLLQLWPAPAQKPVVHKATSHYGASIRSPDTTPKGWPAWMTPDEIAAIRAARGQ